MAIIRDPITVSEHFGINAKLLKKRGWPGVNDYFFCLVSRICG